MFCLPTGLTSYFDVDSTLIYWKTPKYLETSADCYVKLNGRNLHRYVIVENIEELKLQKESGSQIIVWSASGGDWAKAVVEALKIEDYVDICMGKPIRMYDDLDPSQYLPKPRHMNRESLED